MVIKNFTTINIHHGDGAHEVWIKNPDLQEMIKADSLHDLPEFVDALFRAPHDPALQDALDRVKIVYRLSKP
jgi:hypothetical protein